MNEQNDVAFVGIIGKVC